MSATVSRPRIMFVDDEPSVRAVFGRVMATSCEVVLAADGVDALAKLEERGPFEVVITDLHMPRMDGFALVDALVVRAPDTVRAVISAHASFEAAMQLINSGHVFALLEKPLTPAALENAVLRCVERHRLVVGERQLAAQAITESIAALSELVLVASPAAYRRSSDTSRCARFLSARLGLGDGRALELASLLATFIELREERRGCEVDRSHLPLEQSRILHAARVVSALRARGKSSSDIAAAVGALSATLGPELVGAVGAYLREASEAPAAA